MQISPPIFYTMCKKYQIVTVTILYTFLILDLYLSEVSSPEKYAEKML